MSESKASKAKLVGSVLADRFLVKKKLAAGGMGVVYLGEQTPLGRKVAIKILDTSKLDEERAANFSERFFLEAAAVAQLQHPNTITIYDYGKTDDETFFYAMEFVDGASLSRIVHKSGPLPPAAVIHIGVQICASLREAHKTGMIHRDLKPGNIMLTERHDDPYFVKVLDFGLVKVMGQEEVQVELTQSGTLLGSPRYMAPEQVLRFELDHRCDIYSLGGVLYHALTGFPPFQHESQFQVLRAQVEEMPPPLREVYPECEASERLEALVMGMLEKERGDRPADMRAVAEELIACGKEIGVEEVSLSGSSPLFSSPSNEIPKEILDEEGGTSATKNAKVSAEISQIRAAKEEEAADAAPVAAPSEERASPFGMWALLGLVSLLAAGAGIAFVAMMEDETAETAPVAQPPPETTEAPDEGADEGDEAAPPLRVVSEPTGARIRRDGVDLGDAPFTLEIPEGESWTLEVSLAGHETRTVLATPGRDELHVRLTPVVEETSTRRGGRRRRAPSDDTASETGSEGGSEEGSGEHFEDRGDLRHPWAH